MRTPTKVIQKRYEDKHKEERKAKSMVWGTSVDRKFAEEINEFLRKYGYNLNGYPFFVADNFINGYFIHAFISFIEF